jgi:hypothetical protein
MAVKRVLLAVVVAIVVYVLAAPSIGLAWPYPLRLPDRTHFHGEWYHQTGDCPAHVHGGAVPTGEMWTAFGVIGRPTLYVPRGMADAEQPPTIAVRTDGCFHTYNLHDASGP